MARVSAPVIEAKVLETVRSSMGDRDVPEETLREKLDRITIGPAGLNIRWSDALAEDGSTRVISVPWSPKRTRRRREILQGEGQGASDLRPMRVEAQRAFFAAYGKARGWINRLAADAIVSVATIAAEERRSERSIRQTLSLAFLDPSPVEAAMAGKLPRGFGLKRLIDLPPAWPEQWAVLGLQAPARN